MSKTPDRGLALEPTLRLSEPKSEVPLHKSVPLQSSIVGLGGASGLSKDIHQLLAEADSRLFPGANALVLPILCGEDSAAKLVSDELLQSRGLPFDSLLDDPLEIYTDSNFPKIESVPPFADIASETANLVTGAPGERRDSMPPDLFMLRSGPQPTLSLAQVSESYQSKQPLDELLAQTQGSMEAFTALKVLWRIYQQKRSGHLTLQIPLRAAATFIASDGCLVAAESRWERQVAAYIEGEAFLESLKHDTDVAAWLSEEIRKGRFTQFEIDRARRLAMEQFLIEAMVAEEGTFDFRKMQPRQPSPSASSRLSLWAEPLPQLLLRCLREQRKIPQKLLPKNHQILVGKPELETWLAEVGFEAEYRNLFQRMSGKPWQIWTKEAPDEHELGARVFLALGLEVLEIR